MKSFFPICVVSVSVLAAQAPTPAPQTTLPPQAAAAKGPPPKTVIATVNGRKITFGELQNYVRAMPQQMQQNAMSNRKAFIQQIALMQKLADLAEKAKLEQSSPYKDVLEFNRWNILAQAQIAELPAKFPVQFEEQQKYYDENKDRYNQVKLKIIYIPYSASPSQETGIKRTMTELEAQGKAQRLYEEIKGGADFVKLVKENSEDKTSAAKDGDFGTISRGDNLPEAIRTTVFKLKVGEISEPVKQPNGFYIFRAEGVTAKTFQEVRDEIFNDIQKARIKVFLDDTNKNLDIVYNDEAFFAAPPSAPASGPQLLPTPNPGK